MQPGSYEKFEKYLYSSDIFALIKKSSRIIVALSGGADSVLLLNFMKCFSGMMEREGRNIVIEAAHLNHMIRGEEADRDEEFCKKTAEEMGIKLHVARVDIPLLASEGGSIEEVARRERYRFFDSLCDEGTLVATAHNSDDNLETMLFNLSRGTSLKGLCGIPVIRDGRYIRPLLVFSSDEVRKICSDSGIEYVKDSTNDNIDYSRNRIRNIIVPELKKINENAEANALRTAESLRTDYDFIENEAGKALIYPDGSCRRADLSKMADAPLSRVIIKLYEKSGKKEGCFLESIHIKEIISRIKIGSDSYRLDVPGGVSFIIENERIRFAASGAEDDGESETLSEKIVDIGKVFSFFDYKILIEPSGSDGNAESNIYNLSIKREINSDKISGNIIVRNRITGDRYLFGGIHRKVKKLFSDSKIPEEERSRIPLFCDDNGIFWIPGFPVRDDLKIEKDCGRYTIFVKKIAEER